MGGWRLPKRLGAVTVGSMPLKLALAIRETPAGHKLGALPRGGGGASNSSLGPTQTHNNTAIRTHT